MSTQSGTFKEAGTSGHFVLQPGQSATYTVSGKFSGCVFLDRSDKGLEAWVPVLNCVSKIGMEGTLKNESVHMQRFRFRTSDTAFKGKADYEITDADDEGEKKTKAVKRKRAKAKASKPTRK